MIVIFVSECEKKALTRTRRILDSYATRIGRRTWQTLITEKGLEAVKKNLKSTATKNTAVACHKIRGNNLTELVWIVGNRRKFNEEGAVPVNTTSKGLLNWENDWKYLPLIQALTALAALFSRLGQSQ